MSLRDEDAKRREKEREKGRERESIPRRACQAYNTRGRRDDAFDLSRVRNALD